jgi:hypothetical protein
MSLAVIDKVHDIFVKIFSMYIVPTFRVFLFVPCLVTIQSWINYW